MTRWYASQIDVLVQCGAHLTAGPAALGEMLCIAGAKGNVKRLTSLLKSRADLSQPDISNRTALHLAVQHNKVLASPAFYMLFAFLQPFLMADGVRRILAG